LLVVVGLSETVLRFVMERTDEVSVYFPTGVDYHSIDMDVGSLMSVRP